MSGRYAIVEQGIVKNIAVSEEPLDEEWIQSDTAQIGYSYADGVFTPPASPPSVVPEICTALQGLLAIDHAGLAAGYQSWASSEDRSFAERAFIDKALTWRRDDPVLIAGATAMGLGDEDIDNLFVIASQL